MDYTIFEPPRLGKSSNSVEPSKFGATSDSAKLPPSEPSLLETSPITLLDDEITALGLQLEEIRLHESKSKGKYAVGSPPDTKTASDDFQAEILLHMGFLKDLKMAHSIAHAVNTDAKAIAELNDPEKQARDDREFASRLRGVDDGERCTVGSSSNTANLFLDLGIDREETINLDIEDDACAKPSGTYADQQAKVLEEFSQMHECNVCYETFRAPFTVVLPCMDRYCIGCLKKLFLDATTDESLFPARCCRQPIPLHHIQRQCSSDELRRIRNAEIEFSTSDRTYCSNVGCAIFIDPTNIMGSKANCPLCSTETCTACKATFHANTDCPADPALQATLAVANEQGWQRCYSCRTMVELDHGCNHMT